MVCEALGLDRSEEGLPVLDFALCGDHGRPVRTDTGFSVQPDHDLGRAGEADLVVVPAVGRRVPALPAAVAVLREAVARGARVLSLCSGAFALGTSGLLDDRECTTHWRYTAELAQRFPLPKVVPEVLYVDTGQVVTSAGTAAGLDACLHVWREEHGTAVATRVARRMVVPPHRDGGQAQFIDHPVPTCEAQTLGPLLRWMEEHLDAELDVASLARRSSMPPSNFARRFRTETGTTPHAWVTSQRVMRAEALLEQGGGSIEWIAGQVGFANAATLRRHFSRVRGVSPQLYQRRFAA